MAGQWRPACKVRLQVRFDDFLDLPPVPSPPGVAGAEGFGLGGEHPIGTGGFLSTGFDFVPDSAVVERNSFRKADTFRIEFPFERLPFDPQIIRAISVQVFGGVFSESEYAAAMGPVDGPGLTLPDTVPIGRKSAGFSNEIFRGFADSVKRVSGNDGTKIRIEGRDLTGILLDEEIPENAVRDIPGDLPLDVVIQQIITGDGIPNSPRRNGVPGARGLKVVNEATDPLIFDPATGEVYERLPLPPISDFKGPQWLDSKRAAKKGRKVGPGTSHKISYWDLITDLCVSAGFICFIRAKLRSAPGASGAMLPPPELVIALPRTYYGASGSLGGPVPAIRVRKAVIGYNAREVSIEKKFAGKLVPVVEVRSQDVVTGLPVSGRFPPVPPLTKLKNNRPKPSGFGDNQEVKVYLLRELNFGQGQTTSNLVQLLQEAARSIREQIGRDSLQTQIQTDYCSLFEDNWSDPNEADMFHLQAGDPIRIETAPASLEDGVVSPDTLWEKQSFEQRTLWFAQAGLPPASAAFAAQASSSEFLQKDFRVQTVTYDYGMNSGWKFTVDAINYLIIREGAPDELSTVTAP